MSTDKSPHDSGEDEREQKVRVWHLAPDRTRIEYLSPESGNMLLESGAGRWYFSQRRGRWRSIAWRRRVSRRFLLLGLPRSISMPKVLTSTVPSGKRQPGGAPGLGCG